MIDQSILIHDIIAERNLQDETWGGPLHDDKLSTANFVQFIKDYAGMARQKASQDDLVESRRRLVQVAALAVAAAQRIDRILNNERE